jgi:hypothetical protein
MNTAVKLFPQCWERAREGRSVLLVVESMADTLSMFIETPEDFKRETAYRWLHGSGGSVLLWSIQTTFVQLVGYRYDDIAFEHMAKVKLSADYYNLVLSRLQPGGKVL